MSVFWATQYRPDDVEASVAAASDITAMFKGVGAERLRGLVALTQDVGTIAIVTEWPSLSAAVKAFDPVSGSAFEAIKGDPKLTEVMVASGTPLRRLSGTIDAERGDLESGDFVINVVQRTEATPVLWNEIVDTAFETMSAAGVTGMQTTTVLTGDATGLKITSIYGNDVDGFTSAFAAMPPRLLELFAATNTRTEVRNVHRVIRG